MITKEELTEYEKAFAEASKFVSLPVFDAGTWTWTVKGPIVPGHTRYIEGGRFGEREDAMRFRRDWVSAIALYMTGSDYVREMLRV
jgi:hypothetical protein